MSIRYRLCRALCLTVLAAGLSHAGAALASPTVNAAGAKCVPENGASINVTSDSEAQNMEGSIATVICPAERSVSSPVDTTFSGVVWVIDLSPTQSVCCRAVSRNATSGKVVGPFACTSAGGFGTSTQALSITSITDTFTFSSYYFECQVPAANADGLSGILAYRSISQ